MTTRALCAIALAVLAGGCSTQQAARPRPAVTTAEPDYAKPLRPGSSALRPAREMPDLAAAWRSRDALLLDGVDR
ncbi:MAG: hypothetical protein ACYTJ0_05790, partial [Planctomycetota bacterium]